MDKKSIKIHSIALVLVIFCHLWLLIGKSSFNEASSLFKTGKHAETRVQVYIQPDPPTRGQNKSKNPVSSAKKSTEGGVQSEAHALSNITPEYPWRSRKLGESGKTLVKVNIDELGKVSSVTIVKSSGFKRLDSASLKAAALANFTPAKKDSNAVKSEKVLTFNFILND
jgi:TonB family protein